MKLLPCLFAASLLAAPALAADPVSLLGTWKGEAAGVGAEDGWKSGPVVFVIAEQRGRAFTGVATYPAGGGEASAEVFGSIGADNRTVVMADEDGSYAGALTGADSLELCYIESGPDASTKCLQVTRQN